VSGKLIGQFVENLERDVLSGSAGPAPEPVTIGGPAESTISSTAPDRVAAPENNGGTLRRIDGPEAQPVDLLSTAGSPLAKRIIPVIAGLLALLLLVRRRARRRRA
jgi:hypothetical protein